MAISVIQRTSIGNAATSSTIALAYGSNLTANSTLIAVGFISGNASTLTAITDSKGQVWNLVYTLDKLVVGGSNSIKVWVVDQTATGADTVTITTGFRDSSLHIYEVAGLASAGAFDLSNQAIQASATSLSSGNITTTHPNELLIGLAVNADSASTTQTVGVGYSNLQTQIVTFNNSATEEQVVSIAGTYAATFGQGVNTTNTSTAIISFSDTGNIATTSTSSTSSSISTSSTSASTSVSSTSHSTSTSSTSTSTSVSSTSQSTSQSTSVSSTSQSTSQSTSTSVSTTSQSTSISSTSASTSISSTSQSTSISSTSSSHSTSTSSTSQSISTSSTSASTSLSSTSSSQSTSTSSTSQSTSISSTSASTSHSTSVSSTSQSTSTSLSTSSTSASTSLSTSTTTLPLLETLNDPFVLSSLDITKWTEFIAGGASTTYTITGAQVNYPASSTSVTDGDIFSNTPYRLTNSYGYLRVQTVPSAATSADAELRLRIDPSNYIRWVYEAGTLFAQYDVAGSRTTAFSVAYNSTTHAWWRIREGTGAAAGGTVGNLYWDTSTDGVTWTQRATVATPIAVTSLTVLIAGTCFQNETTPGVYKWSNFNTTLTATTSTSSTSTSISTSSTSASTSLSTTTSSTSSSTSTSSTSSSTSKSTSTSSTSQSTSTSISTSISSTSASTSQSTSSTSQSTSLSTSSTSASTSISTSSTSQSTSTSSTSTSRSTSTSSTSQSTSTSISTSTSSTSQSTSQSTSHSTSVSSTSQSTSQSFSTSTSSTSVSTSSTSTSQSTSTSMSTSTTTVLPPTMDFNFIPRTVIREEPIWNKMPRTKDGIGN